MQVATGKFKNGGDPYTMYQTLTRGFGMMVPQTWMVPEQKYDVIHYIRRAYLKDHNPDQYFAVDQAYLPAPRGQKRPARRSESSIPRNEPSGDVPESPGEGNGSSGEGNG